jgi:hypothetical protein
MTLTQSTTYSLLAVALGIAGCSHDALDRGAEQNTATGGVEQNVGTGGTEQNKATGGNEQDVGGVEPNAATGGADQSAGTGGSEPNAGAGGTEEEAGTGGSEQNVDGVEPNAGAGGTDQNAGAGGSAGQSLPDPIPSRQTVTFELTNVTDAPIALLVSGDICTAFEIWRVDGSERTRVVREVDYSNVEFVCRFPRCVAIDDTGSGTYEWVAPGETRVLTWDAREEVVFKERIECSNACGWSREADILTGVAQPAQAGDYEAVFAWFPAGDGCPQTTSGGFICVAGAGMGSTGQSCGGRSRVTVPLVLPASGDVTVTVEVG